MRESLCCHTHPNDRLLQLIIEGVSREALRLSYPSKRQASTTCRRVPTRTLLVSCHTHPSDRLLQRWRFALDRYSVKLSYPSKRQASTTCRRVPTRTLLVSCHTHPSDRLLQRWRFALDRYSVKLSYPSKRQASTTVTHRGKTYNFDVVIPIQTTGFHNTDCRLYLLLGQSCHTHPNDRLLQQDVPVC